jgi:hypothetical protein
MVTTLPAEQVQCQIKSDDDDLDLDYEDNAPAKTGYYFCKNGPVSNYHLTEEDREEISSIRIPAQPTNPVFVQVMHPSHVRGEKPGVVVSDLPSLQNVEIQYSHFPWVSSLSRISQKREIRQSRRY